MTRRVTVPAEFGRVAVLMGGWSREREVSLWSGKNVLEALRRRGVEAEGVDADRSKVLGLRAAGYDLAFNLLHGTGGEDGTVQAALDLQGLPYPGTGVLGSALAMDKVRSKQLWRASGMPVPSDRVAENETEAHDAAEVLGFPFFMKPAADGSSVGVSRVANASEIEAAWSAACSGEGPVLCEQFLPGPEYTCAVLDGRALPLVRIEPAANFYDYDAKYVSDDTKFHCPCGLDVAQEQAWQSLCLDAYTVLGGADWGRIDFMLDGDGRACLLEANTIPGMTTHSLVPMSAQAAGMSFDDLCWNILETALPALEQAA